MSIFKGSIVPVWLTPISRLYAETVPEFARAAAYLVSTFNTLPSLLIDANPASLLRVFRSQILSSPAETNVGLEVCIGWRIVDIYPGGLLFIMVPFPEFYENSRLYITASM